MKMELIRLSEVASRLAVSKEMVGKLIHRGIMPVLELSGSEEPMVPAYAVQQVKVYAYNELLRRHIISPLDYSPPKSNCRWSIDMEHWFSHHEDVADFMFAFLRYVAAMTKSHSFEGFKTVLGITAEGRHCTLIPQARGLVLKVTRAKKPVRYVIRSFADFAGGLAWILSLKDPRGRHQGRKKK